MLQKQVAADKSEEEERQPAGDGVRSGAVLHLVALIAHQQPGYEGLLQVRGSISLGGPDTVPAGAPRQTFRDRTL